MRLHHRVADVGAVRAVRRDPQRAARDQGATASAGLDAELKLNSPLHVRARCRPDRHAEGKAASSTAAATRRATRSSPPGSARSSTPRPGCAPRIAQARLSSSGARPCCRTTAGHARTRRKNSIIGGAAFWVMTSPSRKPEEYKGGGRVLPLSSAARSGRPKWHNRHRLPARHARRRYERVKPSGFYQQNPGTDIPFLQMTRTPTDRELEGPAARQLCRRSANIIQEELEKAFQGQQTAQQALDNAVQRGTWSLRNFERRTARSREGRPPPRIGPCERRASSSTARSCPTCCWRRSSWSRSSSSSGRPAQAVYQSIPAAGRVRAAACSFVWFENYRDRARRPALLGARAARTLVFTLAVTVLSMAPALLLAVMADKRIRGATAYKTLLIWPYAVAPAVAGGARGSSSSTRRSASLGQAVRELGIDWDYNAQRRPGDVLRGPRRGLEAGELQLPVLPGRPAVDPEAA